MEEDQKSQDLIHFQLSFALDRDRFFRRTCPSCGRDFKTKADEADLAASIEPSFRQRGLEIGAFPAIGGQDKQRQHLTCPYCEYYMEIANSLTEAFGSYIRLYIMREYVLPKVNAMFSDIADIFGNQKTEGSGGMFGLEIKVSHDESSLPPRPISGPEPPDMTKVLMLCCGKAIKILDGWYDLGICPYCGTRVTIQ
jgi:DNA-directed RNA polymerase subunit RPC12/RpoP